MSDPRISDDLVRLVIEALDDTITESDDTRARAVLDVAVEHLPVVVDPTRLRAAAPDVVEAVLNDLCGRKGFDWAWDDIDEDIQQEIREELAERVADVLAETPAPTATEETQA